MSYAAAAFLFWGLVPVYWKHLSGVPALESVMHRVVWSALLLAVWLAAQGRWGSVRAALSRRASLLPLLATTLLIAANWLLFVWAVNAGRLLDASLGYFMTPIMNVLLGMIFLGERLRGAQAAAALLAAAGVANLVASYGAFPWIPLALSGTFAVYGLLRKTAPVDALVGLGVETFLLSGPCLAALLYMGARDGSHFLESPLLAALLIGTGPVTTLPLYWFAQGARRLELKSLGFTQYLSPTCHFLLAVLLYGEALPAARLASFILIWAALGLYTWDALRRAP